MPQTQGMDRGGGRPWGRRPLVVLPVVLVALLAAPQLANAETVVSVLRSDDPALPAPVAADQRLEYAQHIRPMVRRAVEQAGLRQLVQSATPGADGVVDVVCKVNIVHAAHVQGDITDWRVVKAVFEAVHEWAPQARLTIAEGGVWIPPERTGYRDLLRDPDLAGADLRIVDLNYDDAEQRQPPGGGLVAESYWVPRTVLDAEVFISVPVLKITGSVGMTVAVKNLIGIAPGLKYGWSKSRGWPPGSGNVGLWHSSRTLDETLEVFAAVAGVDFAVVDGIVGMERGRIRADGGLAKRMNIIAAGADLLAVDAVAARLMGMNPADMEFLQLGQRRGLGVGSLDSIRVIGDLARLARPFEKRPQAWDEYAHFGMGNHTWLLRGPIPSDSVVAIDAALAPRPGVDGWSAPVYFHDDRIDLDRHFDNPSHCYVDAYAEYVAPRDQAAELWVGSDEGLQVWIDGVAVYEYGGRRRHALPSDRVAVRLTTGRHRVVVRAWQRRGDFDFSLKLCEVETDSRYDGNAVFGLRWQTPGAGGELTEVRVVDRPRNVQWYSDADVDETQGGRIALHAFLPADGQGTWAGLGRPLAWAESMELTVRTDGRRIQAMTENIATFRLTSVGPLSGLRPGAAVEIERGATVALGDIGPGESVCLGLADGRWQVVDAASCGDVTPVAEATATLSNGDLTDPYYDTGLGNWFGDSITWVTGADIAFQNNGGIREPLEAGEVTVNDIFFMNYPNELCTFEITGAELLEVLEFDVRDGNERPMQVAGLRYAVDRSRDEGQRVVDHDLDVDRIYTAAAEAYIVQRGGRFFNREIEWASTGQQIVDAQIRYARQQGTIVAPPLGRIRRVD